MKACLGKMGFRRLKTAVMATTKKNMTYLPDYVCSDVEAPQDKIPWTLATAPLASVEEPSSFECTLISK
jgi:hypothetical protein